MRHLPPEWTELASRGVSLRIGSCNSKGVPSIGRALAAEVLPDGRIKVLLEGQTCEEVLEGVRDTGQVALVMALPSNHRTLHLKGCDGEVSSAETAADHTLLQVRLDAFTIELAPFGFTREILVSNWYDVRQGDLWAVCFSIAGAWDQTPGPGAGQPLELLP